MSGSWRLRIGLQKSQTVRNEGFEIGDIQRDKMRPCADCTGCWRHKGPGQIFGGSTSPRSSICPGPLSVWAPYPSACRADQTGRPKSTGTCRLFANAHGLIGDELRGRLTVPSNTPAVARHCAAPRARTLCRPRRGRGCGTAHRSTRARIIVFRHYSPGTRLTRKLPAPHQ